MSDPALPPDSEASSRAANASATLPALRLARRMARHYRTFALVLGVGLALSALLVRHTNQVYRSETVILYRQIARQGYGEGDSSRRAGTRLADMLFARERLHKMLGELGLYPRQRNRNAAADEMKKAIGFQARDGSTFLITFDAATPGVAQAGASRLATTLIEDNAKLRAAEAEETRRFLDQERVRLGEEVARRQAALATYLRGQPAATSVSPHARGANKTNAEAKPGAPPAPVPTPEPVVAARPDPELLAAERRALLETVQARRDLAEKQERLTDAHPDLIVARERLRMAEANLRRVQEASPPAPAPTAATTASSLAPAPPRSSSRDLASLERRLAALRAGARRFSGQTVSPATVELDSLRHNLQQARERLAGLEDKQFQAALLAKLETGGQIGQLMVLDPASRPGLPFVDKRKKVAVGGLAAALALALAAALLRARSDDRIFDREDIETLAGARVLAVLPARPARRRAHA